jgi:hypothetical protein
LMKLNSENIILVLGPVHISVQFYEYF